MSELVVLFEDNAHESLLRQVLSKAYGLKSPKVRYMRCTDCVGVEKSLPGEVQRLREKRHQRSRGLLVVIDVDRFGVDGRKRRLDAVLTESGLVARQQGGRIAYVVPRLEAENWYVHFCCPARRPVDEAHDYKSDGDWRRLEKNLGAAARELARAWGEALDEDLPSIADARREFTRVTALP
jgi:hypothetical protein